MTHISMGEIINSRRKELNLTQRELAEQLNITDKAVSKWERGVAYPDTATLPKLAEILDVSVEELLNAKSQSKGERQDADSMIDLILRVIPIAMGVAVAVTAPFGTLAMNHGFSMLGLGIACIGIYLLRNR